MVLVPQLPLTECKTLGRLKSFFVLILMVAGRSRILRNMGGDTEEIDGSVASGVTIISGHKTLILDHAKAFAGVFSGIAVDLTDITADSYAFDKNTGVATFFNSDSKVFTLRTDTSFGVSSYRAFHGASGSGIVLAQTQANGQVDSGPSVGTILPLHN
jgi:hypothetical protein